MSLPELPNAAPNCPWPPSIHTAYSSLQRVYQSVSDAIGASNLDSHHIQNYLDRLSNDTLPLLSDLDQAAAALGTGSQILEKWLFACVKAFGTLFAQLLQLQKETRGT
jgi:hypothetical protein